MSTSGSVADVGVGLGTTRAVTISWMAHRSLFRVILLGIPGWIHVVYCAPFKRFG